MTVTTAAVLGALVLAVALSALTATALTLRHHYVLVTVAGLSMAPTLRPGDRLVVRRTAPGRIRSGDVVVLAPDPELELDLDPESAPATDHGELWLIKRAAAVPGDPVPRTRVPALADAPEALVPHGKLVLLGDNTAHSTDSRQRGYFDAQRLVGRVVRQR